MRLEVLRLLASTIADEARDIEGVKVKTAQPKRSKRTMGVRAVWLLFSLLHAARALCVRFWREKWRFVW